MLGDGSVPETETRLTETISGVVDCIKRRRWLIILCVLVTALGAAAIALHLPRRYRAEATLLVVQPEVSQRYVSSDDGMNMADTANALKQDVLSRLRLNAIVKEFGLYEKERGSLPPDEIVDRMRKDVEMEPLEPISSKGEFSTFKIAFVGDNAHLAQAVTSRLASLFIEENFRARGNQAASTSTFLTDQLEEAKKKVAVQEQRLKDFKTRNVGQLPEQQGATLGSLTESRIRLQTITEGLTRAQRQRALIETSMHDSLAQLQSDRAKLMNRLTSRHPDVVRIDREIAKVQVLIEGLKTGRFETDTVPGSASSDNAQTKLKSQVAENLAEIQNFTKEEQRVNSEIAKYQTLLNLTPVRQEELSEITRDYELCKQSYSDLVKQYQQAQLTIRLEERQGGLHFRLLESPELPRTPSTPNPLKVSLTGAAVGVLLGLALTLLMEARDHSFHNERALTRSFAFPLVISLPLFLTPAEKRARLRTKSFEWVAGSVLFVTVCIAEFYVYRHG